MLSARIYYAWLYQDTYITAVLAHKHLKETSRCMLWHSRGMRCEGGICLDTDRRHQGKDIGSFDPLLARNLAAFFGPRSVLDLGCGLGEYGKAFKGHVRSWVKLHTLHLTAPR